MNDSQIWYSFDDCRVYCILYEIREYIKIFNTDLVLFFDFKDA